MDNFQIISGVLQLNRESGSAQVDFRTGAVTGDADPDTGEGGVRGATGRTFRFTPHAIVSPSDLSLSTRSNTSYRIFRNVNRERLSISWRIDSPRGGGSNTNDILEIDFLAIGEVA